MQSELHCETVDLHTLFSHRYQFSVPEFQRPYTWSTREAGQLFEDIFSGMEAARRSTAKPPIYFLGSIILIKQREHTRALVVDGQQRIITLTILLSCLRDRVREEFARSIHDRIYQQEDLPAQIAGAFRVTPNIDDVPVMTGFVQERGATRNRFASIPMDDSEDDDENDGDGESADEGNEAESPDAAGPADHAEGGPAPRDSHLRIIENRNLFLKELSQIPDTVREELSTFIVRNCRLIVVTVPAFDDAYRVFSILHTRGAPLSFVDVLKAQIIGRLDPAERTKYAAIWQDCEGRLGRAGFEALFQQMHALAPRARDGGDTVSSYFLAQLDKIGSEALISEQLAPQCQVLSGLFNGTVFDKPANARLNGLLAQLSCLYDTDWMGFALLWLRQARRPEEKDLDFFRHLERFFYYQTIYSGATHERQRAYRGALAGLLKDVGSYPDVLGIPMASIEKNVLKKLSSSSKKNSFYIKALLLRFEVKARGDGAMVAPAVRDAWNVEHVLPLGGGRIKSWKAEFSGPKKGGGVAYFGDKWVERLGNLILLERGPNARIGNSQFTDKVAAYATSESQLAREATKSPSWTKDVIQRRTDGMLGALRKDWNF